MLDQRIKEYKESIDIINRGGINCIPFKEFLPRLSKHLIGIVKSTYYCITSYTNVGKTPLAKFLFVRIPFYYYTKYKKTKNSFKLRILYFCLEETKSQFIDSLVIAELYERYNITIDYNQLNSLDSPLDNAILLKIEELRGYFNELASILEIIAGVSSPEGIISIIRQHAARHGKFFYKGNEVEPGEEFDEYVSNNDHTIIVIDHLNLLNSTDRSLDLRRAMSKMSSEYLLGECIKHYGYSVCAVHQQSAEGESAEYNKFNKNECSLTTLGDNKAIARDYMVVLALDMPQRYGITEHNRYDLRKFKDRSDCYRSLTILKNRFGRARVRVSAWFTNTWFEELPNPDTINYANYA